MSESKRFKPGDKALVVRSNAILFGSTVTLKKFVPRSTWNVDVDPDYGPGYWEIEPAGDLGLSSVWEGFLTSAPEKDPVAASLRDIVKAVPTQRPPVEVGQLVLILDGSIRAHRGSLAKVLGVPEHGGACRVRAMVPNEMCDAFSWAIADGPVEPGDVVIPLHLVYSRPRSGGEGPVIDRNPRRVSQVTVDRHGTYVELVGTGGTWGSWAKVESPAPAREGFLVHADTESGVEMTTIDVPPGIPTQTPTVKVGEKVLGLGWLGKSTRENNRAVGLVDKVRRIGDSLSVGDRKAVAIGPDDSPRWVDSWAIVDGTVFVGDRVIVLDAVNRDIIGKICVVDHVSHREGRIGVNRSWLDVTSWAKLEPETAAPEGSVPQCTEESAPQYTDEGLRKALKGNRAALEALGLIPRETDKVAFLSFDFLETQAGSKFVSVPGSDEWHALYPDAKSYEQIATKHELKDKNLL